MGALMVWPMAVLLVWACIEMVFEGLRKERIKGKLENIVLPEAPSDTPVWKVEHIEFLEIGHPNRVALDLNVLSPITASEKEGLQQKSIDQLKSMDAKISEVFFLKAQRPKLVLTTLKTYTHLPVLLEETLKIPGVQGVEMETTTEKGNQVMMMVNIYIRLEIEGTLTKAAQWMLQDRVAQAALEHDPTETLQKVYVAVV